MDCDICNGIDPDCASCEGAIAAWDEAHFEALGCDGTCCDLMHDAPRKSMNPHRPPA